MALAIIGYTLLCLVMLAGLLITPFGLPGNWVILGCAIAYGLGTHWQKFGWPFILALAIAALIGEVIEALSSAYGAKRYGSSTGGMIAAIAGSIVGLALGSGLAPIVGTIIGAFAGAFLGAFLYEYVKLNDPRQAFRSGLGAFLGRTAAIIVKEVIGILMVGLLVYQFLT